MVLVSIIIPTNNRKDLLIKAVESILLQTYSNWELFIINDHENPIQLKKWSIIDHQNNETTVALLNIKKIKKFNPKVFELIY